MKRWAIPAHVHVCLDGDHVVFLDLLRDRYWALPAQATRGFSALVERWTVPGATCPGPSADPEMLGMLLSRGLLCDRAVASEVCEPLRAPPPKRDAASIHDLTEPASIRPMTFLAAASFAAAILKVRGLQYAVARTQRLRASAAAQRAPAALASAIALVAAFERLRPLLFSARDACLFNSFVLIEFLARHACHPCWIFGVRARPFAAHCWVQLGDTVLNDSLEHVSRYTPILVA